MMRSGRRRRSGYPDDYIQFAERLYEVDGLAPKAIQRRLEESRPDVELVPYDTLKGWVRPLTRGAGRDDGDAPRWDFKKATPEARRLIAPLFAATHLRGEIKVSETGQTRPARPVVMWPSQDVGDWFVRIRDLLPKLPVDLVWMDARYLAMLERRFDDGSATAVDRGKFDDYLADILEQAGSYQEAVLEDTGTPATYLDVDPETGEYETKDLDLK
jgi:hypothetical protein